MRGLRDYGIEPVVWGGVAGCGHGWGDIGPAHHPGQVQDNKAVTKENAVGQNKGSGQFCRLCGAWRGCLGLEPTIELFVAHIVEIFREVRRVLRKDGTVFCNLGDSYSSSPAGNKTQTEFAKRGGQYRMDNYRKDIKQVSGLKPKDLCGVPWRVALALQADGWWLRSDIIWAKPNPMPESVTDRPTRSHEYIFLLTKSARYFWDVEAVREKAEWERWGKQTCKKEYRGIKPIDMDSLEDRRNNGRNLRSVWSIATAPFPAAHFATFPPALVERCIRAGTSEKGVCGACISPWVRVVEKKPATMNIRVRDEKKGILQHKTPGHTATADEIVNYGPEQMGYSQTLGFRPSCTCADSTPVPATVMDIFSGAGTTCLVAAKMGRYAIGIEMKPEYQEIAAKRIKGELGMLVDIQKPLDKG